MELIKNECPICKVELTGFGIGNYRKNVNIHLINIHKVSILDIEWDNKSFKIKGKKPKAEKPKIETITDNASKTVDDIVIEELGINDVPVDKVVEKPKFNTMNKKEISTFAKETFGIEFKKGITRMEMITIIEKERNENAKTE